MIDFYFYLLIKDILNALKMDWVLGSHASWESTAITTLSSTVHRTKIGPISLILSIKVELKNLLYNGKQNLRITINCNLQYLT